MGVLTINQIFLNIWVQACTYVKICQYIILINNYLFQQSNINYTSQVNAWLFIIIYSMIILLLQLPANNCRHNNLLRFKNGQDVITMRQTHSTYYLRNSGDIVKSPCASEGGQGGIEFSAGNFRTSKTIRAYWTVHTSVMEGVVLTNEIKSLTERPWHGN